MKRSDGRTFSFVVEFDNGTERVRSKQDVESIERKMRGYDAHISRSSMPMIPTAIWCCL